MIVTTGGYVHAGDVYTLSFPNLDLKYTESTAGYFTVNNTGNNNNAKYWCTFNGVKYNCGMKMNKGTISFTSTSSAKLTIVQAYDGKEGATKKEPGYNPILDGTEITKDKFSTTNCEGCRFVEIDIKAGSHVITSTKEIGIAYVQVEYTGSSMTQLTEPTIDFNNETGFVTISQTEKKDVYYTTDGTDPSTDNGTKYVSAFTVEDGTTVKAIAIGDGTTTINSKVASYYALLKTVTIQKPVITSVNGTVAISCATPGTTFKYSVNGGEQQDYSYPFTLTEDGIVKAQALRDNCTTVESDEVSVTTVKSNSNKQIVLDMSKFVEDQKPTIVGKDEAEGITMSMSSDYQTMSKAVTLNGTALNAIKLSAGKVNTLTLPEGMKADRITFYSVANYPDEGKVTGFSDVNGEQEYTSIPMGAYKTADGKFASTPDVRVYPLDNASTIKFTLAGIQIGVVIALDIVDETPATKKVEINSESGLISFSSTQAYTLPDGLTAYTATCDGSKVTLNKVEDGIVAANQGVVLEGTPNVTYTLNATDAEGTTEWTKNELKNTAANTYTTGADETDVYVLICNSNNKGQFARLNANQTIPVGKAYLKVVGSNAKSLSVGFGDDTTGINTIEAAQGTQNACYNLNGQRISKPAKGLYIMNGKKFVK